MDTVCVLLSAYNGEKYLEEQIESLLAQEGVAVDILVRDDGSVDRTREILEQYRQAGKLRWYEGENLRSARSFLHLLKHAPEAEYYAFCDQDDFWKPEKLRVAVERLRGQGERPALYFSRAQMADAELHIMEVPSRHPFEQLSFPASFIINNVAGCTMVFSHALRERVLEYDPAVIGMHDSWVYKVCLAVDGKVFCDSDSYILYRQHGNNVIGGISSPAKAWKRRLRSLSSSPRYRSQVAGEVLKGYGQSMTEEHRQILALLSTYRQSPAGRWKLAFSRTIRTSYRDYDRMFRWAVLLGKF